MYVYTYVCIYTQYVLTCTYIRTNVTSACMRILSYRKTYQQRPPIPGPLGGLCRYVPLYLNGHCHCWHASAVYVHMYVMAPSAPPVRDAHCSQGAQVPGEGGEASTTTSHALCGARNRGTIMSVVCTHPCRTCSYHSMLLKLY